MQNPSNRVNVYGRLSLVFIQALMIAAAVAANNGGITWDEKSYNPAPARDDFILPMPCGGAMAFRKIETEADGILGDQEIRLGDPEPATGYAENPIAVYLAGSFAGDTKNTRYFFLGKYEVTVPQYQAVMASDCPQPTQDMRLPQTEMNWFNAVEFTNKYSLWLLNHVREQLPRAGEEIGFARLPTETEWEFAARGGQKVSPSDFQARTFPMPEGMKHYVWYAGTESANGKAQFIGLLKPNPLGLYDMLGNVDEVVFDLFRLTKHSRLHGQAGGYIVRGGNFMTAPDQIRASYRQEIPFYKDNSLRSSKTTGLRIALAAPVITSKQQLQTISKEWETLPLESPVGIDHTMQDRQPAAINPSSSGSPLQDLLILSNNSTDPNLKKRLDELRINLSAIIETRNEQRDRAAREALRTASILCQKIRDDESNVIKPANDIFETQCAGGADTTLCQIVKKKLALHRKKAAYNLGFYADAVIELAHNYPLEVLTEQKELLLAVLASREFKDLIPFVKLLYNHVRVFIETDRQDKEAWYKGCIAL